MRTIVISFVCLCIIYFSANIMWTVNKDTFINENISLSLTMAMRQSVSDELFSDKTKVPTNEHLKEVFLNNFLVSLPDGIDVQIRINDIDISNGMLDVSVLGKYKASLNTQRSVNLRRRIELLHE